MEYNIEAYHKLFRHCGHEKASFDPYDIPLINFVIDMKLYYHEAICIRLCYGLDDEDSEYTSDSGYVGNGDKVAIFINEIVASGKPSRSPCKARDKNGKVDAADLKQSLRRRWPKDYVDADSVHNIISIARLRLHSALTEFYSKSASEVIEELKRYFPKDNPIWACNESQ
jgi:hypothetical protein